MFAKVPDAFEHDRAAIVDGVEGFGPGGPVEDAEAGGEVRVLSAVVVVDVGGAEEPAGGEGLGGGVGGDVGVAGVERQGQFGAVELARRGRRGRPSGCRDGRPGACSRRRG